MQRSAAPSAQDTQPRWRVAIPDALALSSLFRREGEPQVLTGATMGTSWCVTCPAPPASVPALRQAIERILDRVIALFSPWESESELNRFNAGPQGIGQAMSPDFERVIACALQIAEQTSGAYDPALGALIDLWGFGPVPRGDGIPPSSEINDALQVSGRRHIRHDGIRGKLARKGGARLDLCGIAKGHAVDLVVHSLRESGITAALVEIGGELSGYGVKPHGTPWWVAIDDNGDHGNLPILVALHDLAIATSGCERSFPHGGQLYSHTIDPRTGRPIDNGMMTATVLHPSCMQADAYATALLVMGPEAAIAFAEQHAMAAVIRYQVSGAISERVSTGLQAMIDE